MSDDALSHRLTVHVSPVGDDAASGTRAAPFRTLAAARDHLRANPGDAGGRIVVHGGEYWDIHLELTAEDSGTTIEAAEGETPILYGGHRIDNWEPDEGPLVSAALPGVTSGEWDFRTLVVDDAFAPRARLPEVGRFRHRNTFDVPWMSTTGGGWQRQPTEEELTTLLYSNDDLGDWLEPANAEIQVFHQWDDSLVGVAGIDLAQKTVRFRSPTGHPPGSFASSKNPKANEYIVWNIHEGMTQPGQWYLDRVRGRVVYWPRPDDDMSRAVVLAPRHRQIIALRGNEEAPIRCVEIRGLAFALTATPLGSAGFGAGALDGAVDVCGPAEDISLMRLSVRLAGGKGISVRGDKTGPCRAIRVQNCRITTCGGPGIHLRGETCEVRGCVIRDIGLTYSSSLALAAGGTGNMVAENRVSGCPYTAITAGGTSNRIEYNLIRDFMRDLDDGAAIYCFGFKDSLMHGNVVVGSHGRVASAYYLDETSHGSKVTQNIALDSRWPSHNHMSEECEIYNNIFVDSGDQLITLARCHDFVYAKNIFVCRGTLTLRAGRDSVREWSRNLFHAKGGLRVRWVDQNYQADEPEPWTPNGSNSLGKCPLEDPAAGDFRLRPASPATELEIPQLPTRVLELARRALGETAVNDM